MKTKLITPHKKNCRALALFKKGDWSTPWGYVGDAVYRAKDGSKRGRSHRWLIVMCNSVDNCPGRILVQDESILLELPSGEKSTQQEVG